MRAHYAKQFVIIASFLLLWCGGTRAQAPTITSMSPTSGPVGIGVTLTGSNFGASQGSSTVSLNGTTAVATAWSANSITAIVPTGATSGAFSVTVNSQTAQSTTFTVTALPSGWTDEDIGTVGVAGSASFANGVFTVQGAGQQIFGTSDGFNFAYQSMSGDGTIVARVVSVQGGSTYATAGVMIRETLNSGSTNATTAYWPVYTAIYFDLRASTGGSTTQPGVISHSLPYWIKVVRSGSTFSSFTSQDGVTWTQLGSNQTINMAQSTYVGLSVNSGSTTASVTATFDSVSVSPTASPAPAITGISPTSGVVGTQVTITGTGFGSAQNGSLVTVSNTRAVVTSWSNTSITATIPSNLGPGSATLLVSLAPSMNDSNAAIFTVTLPPPPSPWTDADIGSVTAGTVGFTNGIFTVLGGGAGPSGTSDGFHYLYQPLSGDGSIFAEVASAQGNYAPEALVMIRETLNAGSTEVSVGYYSHYIYVFQRSSTGGTTSSASYTYLPGGPPYWVKLVRSGNTFSEYASPDGETWTQLGSSQTITMAQNVYVGLTAAYGTTSAGLTTATFTGVSVNSAATPAPVISSLSASTASVGSQVLINGSNFGSSQGSGMVSLNGSPVTVDSWSATGIVVTIPSGATTGPLWVSVGPTMNDSNAVILEITASPLPTSWTDDDVGSVGGLGSATYANGTFTVVGGGGGATGTADGLHFAYQPLSGDGSIVARIVSAQTNLPQALVMIRETLAAGASEVSVGYNSNNYIYVYERNGTGASTSATNYTYLPSGLPYWVKLVRSGNTFSEYSSLDGVNWAQLGAVLTVSMAQNVYIGMAVSSGSTSVQTTATFDCVSISTSSSPAPSITSISATTGSAGNQVAIGGSGFGASEGNSLVTLNNSPMTINSWGNSFIVVTIPTGATSGYLVVSVAPSMNDSNAVRFDVTANWMPIPWLDQDIGTVGVLGSATYASGTFTVAGGGAGLTGTADALHFAYQTLSGDGSIVAKILTNQGNNAPQAFAMIRETLNAGAAEVSVVYSAANIWVYQRTSTGASASSGSHGSPSLPYWVKLARNGNTFTAFGSTDGATWTQLGSSQTIAMAQTVYAGVGTDYGATSGLTTGTFSNVSVTAGTTPVVSGVSPSLGGFGSSVTIAGSNFGTAGGTVSFNGTNATSITSWTNSQIVAAVPTGATTGLVKVTAGGIQSPTGANFTVINPVISSVTPPQAQIYGHLTLAGSGFGANQGSSSVYINGVWASVSTWSDTNITVSVPSNATSGPVTVIEDGVTSNGVQFTLLEALTVTGISPNIAAVGASVTITGTGFGATQSNSTAIFVLGAAVSVTSWTDTQIVGTVPAGAVTGPVGVCVATQCSWGSMFTFATSLQLTDSLGNQTTYSSAQIGGEWLPTSSQGSGCSSCTQRGTISFTYDTKGHVLSRTDENGHTTTYTYDGNGNVLTVTVPINSSTTATTTYTYNSLNEVLTATDPLGNVTTNTYDSKGNLLTVTTPAPAQGVAASVTTFTYDTKGELLTIKDPLNNVTTLTYTSAGLINTITDAQSNVTTYGYDSHGNRTSVTDALNHQTTFTYDSMDRLTKITYPDTTTTQFGYDYRGRRTSVTDQNGKVTSYAYDDADRLITVTDAASNVTTYGYDTENNLTSIKDAKNHTTSFAYDAFARVTQTTFPSGYIETYGYDSVGNLSSKTDRKNQLITYTYDQLNRLTQKTYPDSTTVNYTYDKDSRLTQVTDPTGTYSFTFDNMGRLTGTTTSYAFLTGRNFTTGYSYDAASNRTGFTDPESGSSTYAYDTLNRLQTLTPPSAISSGNFGFGYDALSRRTSLTRPNSVNTAYSYDNLSRLLSVTHAKSGTTLDGASYAVDNAGNRTSRTPLPSGTASNFTYDSIYELTQVTQGASTTESYTYDPVGNRLSSLGVSSYTNNSSNELTSTSNAAFTYDNDGNTLTKVVGSNTTSYAWDYENRLTSVTLPGSGGTVSFKYDPFGRRIYKSSSSGTSVFAYDRDNLAEEANSSGTAVARYSQGLNIDEPLALLRGSVTSFYQTDDLGSITSLTNGSGTVAQSYTFDSFGNQTASSGSLANPFQYTAREFDSETSLYYYRARYYDTTTGRFISEDPIQFRGGINFYGYGAEDPVNKVDRMGKSPENNNSCKNCVVSVSCEPTHGLDFTHCTITTWDGSYYSDYDAGPTGNIWLSRLMFTQPYRRRSPAPANPSFFKATVPCDKLNCIDQRADDFRRIHFPYNFLLWNSNGAAQYVLNECGLYPHFPWSAWGARQPF